MQMNPRKRYLIEDFLTIGATLFRIALIWLIALIVMAHITEARSATMADAMQKLSGMHERANRVQLKRILGIDPARIPWCGAAVTYAAKVAKRPIPAAPLRAASWKRWGKAVTISSARRGDIAIIKTRRGHHVTVVTRKQGGRICGIGGNQGNRVRESCYSAVVAVRR